MTNWETYFNELYKQYEFYQTIIKIAAVFDFIIFVSLVITFFVMAKKIANIDNKMNTIVLLLSQHTVKKD